MGKVFIQLLCLTLVLPVVSAEARERALLMNRVEPLYVMDTRQNRGAGEAFCAQRENCESIPVTAREFANGNTFVQIDAPLGNRNIAIVAPEVMDTDTFMELLLQAHTARTWGARHVEIHAGRLPMVMDGEQVMFDQGETVDLLAQAGAEFLMTSDEEVDLRKVRARKGKSRPAARPRGRDVVLSMNHPALGAQLAGKLGLEHLDLAGAKDYELPRGQTVVLLSAITIPTNKNLFQSLQVVKRLKALGNKVIQILPYMPYVRSDKIDQPGVTVGGKLAADLLENAGTDIIGFVKLHAAQVQGFFGIPALHIETRGSINKQLEQLGIEAVVSPDAGFQKEATLYAGKLGLPVYVINKQRNPRTGEAELQKMGDFDVKGKVLAVIDDETASGSTLVSSAEFLKSQGAAKVFAFVTHLAGDAGKAIGSKSLDALYVTDTFPVTPDSEGGQLRVIPVVDEIAETLAPFVGAGSCEKELRTP